MPVWTPRVITAAQIDAAGPYEDAPRKLLHASAIAGDAAALLDQESAGYGQCLPWRSTADKLRFRPGEVSVWYGYSGHMKSTLLGQCATSWMAQGARVCVASFEMSPARSLLRMARQAAGVSQPSAEFIQKYAEWSALWFYDHKGLCQPRNVYGLLRYAQTIAIDHVIVDCLMRVVAGEDDYNGQKEFMRNVCSLSNDLQLHTHVVHHARKGLSEGQSPLKADVRGSAAIIDSVDCALAVWRDRADCVVNDSGMMVITKPNATLSIVKQRNGEYEGVIPLWIDAASTQFRTVSDKGMLNLMQWDVKPPIVRPPSAFMH